MKRFLCGLVAAIAIALGATPAQATINPTYTIAYGSPASGSPGQGRLVIGTITLGASDTYVAGGFTITPAQLGCAVQVSSIIINSPGAAYETQVTFTAGNAVVKFSTQMNGASNVTATQTTKTVTIPTGLTTNDVLGINTGVFVVLDDAATGGGGTGTWAVTDAVASVKEASSATFTLTVIAAAPTSGGNFVWFIPSLNMELAAGTSIASLALPFTATCL